MCFADADLTFASTFAFAEDAFPFSTLMIVSDLLAGFCDFMLFGFQTVNIILYYFNDEPFLPFLARLAD